MVVNYKNYHSNLSFLDLFLNTLVVFVFLFLISWLLINPVAKNKIIDTRSEFIITASWPDQSQDDVDLWIQDPLGNILFYARRDSEIMHLDRDDRGLINDIYVKKDGTKENIEINREVASIRGILSGEYTVNLHMFAKRDSTEIPVVVEIIKVNPYELVHKQTIIMTSNNQEVTVVRFIIDRSGFVTSTNNFHKGLIDYYRGTL